MEQQKNIPSLQTYIVGYALSVILTLAIFGLAYIHLQSDHRLISHPVIHAAIAILAVLQFIVQTIFFLHLSLRKEERSKFITFAFMLLIVTIIAGGSLWILTNLNNNMSPEQVSKYMQNED
jgi:cytochrome o ubiquinol oxidase operon protein cyoD